MYICIYIYINIYLWAPTGTAPTGTATPPAEAPAEHADGAAQRVRGPLETQEEGGLPGHSCTSPFSFHFSVFQTLLKVCFTFLDGLGLVWEFLGQTRS